MQPPSGMLGPHFVPHRTTKIIRSRAVANVANVPSRLAAPVARLCTAALSVCGAPAVNDREAPQPLSDDPRCVTKGKLGSSTVVSDCGPDRDIIAAIMTDPCHMI